MITLICVLIGGVVMAAGLVAIVYGAVRFIKWAWNRPTAHG